MLKNRGACDGISRAFDTGKPHLVFVNRDTLSSHLPPGTLEQVLSADEHSYLEQPLHRNTRSRYTAGRAVLRILITHLAKTLPPDRLFFDGMTGPPLDLKCADGTDLCFSVSHSGGYTLFGFCKGKHLGVDIERVRPHKQVLHLAAYAFSQEESRWLSTLDPSIAGTAFLRLWTRKEAVVKYYRGSVAHDMHRFTVPLEVSCGSFSISPGLADESQSLELVDYMLPDGVFGALCRQGPDAGFALHEIDASLIRSYLLQHPELSKKAR